MRYTAPEKLDIIALAERSSLSVRRTLAPLGIPRSTFYGWYRRYAEGVAETLEEALVFAGFSAILLFLTA